MPADGGPARQLTWFGQPRTSILGFAPDGRLAVHSTAGQPFNGDRWAHLIELSDGAAERLPYGPISDIAWASSGAVLVNTGQFRDYAQWKRYRGGTAGRLWLAATPDGEFTEFLPELIGQKSMPVAVGDRFAFLSDAEGHGNVYSVAADGSDLRRHTDHDTFWARQLTGDGNRLSYQCGGDIWRLDDLAADSQARRLDIALTGSRPGRAPFALQVGKHLGHYTVDRTGRASAIEVRGNVVWLTSKNGPARVVAAEAGVRHRLPVILPSEAGDGVAYVTSHDGADGLEIAGPDGRRRRFGAGRFGRVLELVASPDGRTLALATHDGRVIVVDAATEDEKVLAEDPDGEASGLTWSPDSAWLAFAASTPVDEISSIQLIEPATGRRAAVTGTRFADTAPAFSLDGKYLAFLSVRTFDPVYDTQAFDLSFAVGSRPYLVTLAAATRSPFDPDLAGRPIEAPGAEDDGPAVPIELDGIADRVVPFPIRAGRYADLRAVKGGFVWTEAPVAGELGESRQPEDDIRPSLQRWDLALGQQLELSPHLDAVQVSGDGSRLLLRDKDKLLLVPSGKAPSEKAGNGSGGNGSGGGPDDKVTVDLSRIRLTVDPPAEWAQMLDETARLMRDHYWAPDMSGVDWDAAVDRYRPLIDRLGSRDDLSDLLWEVNGETGSSHAYESPPAPEPDPLLEPGFLGADLVADADGWRIDRILRGDNSVRKARSPLTAPGVQARPGDRLVSINGRPIDRRGPAPLLLGLAGKPIALGLSRDGQDRVEVITPLSEELELRYLDWVASRRELVHRASDGRVGYLHVPDMMSAGWAAFHRDLRTEIVRDAVLIDTRYNGGGHTSQLVIEKLARSVVGWDVRRHKSAISYPQDAPRGPLVSLANEWAGSDGDIVNATIKSLELGPVIGTRTWGGVVGIDGRYKLVDGTGVTQPRYSFWFDKYDWSVENYGVDPDIVVEKPPQAWAAGADPQLDAGIGYLLAELERRGPRRQPDVAARPDRAAPALPARPGSGG